MEVDTAHIKTLSDRLYAGINDQLEHVILNGPQDQTQRYVGNLNLSFAYVEGESLLMGLKVPSSTSLQSCIHYHVIGL